VRACTLCNPRLVRVLVCLRADQLRARYRQLHGVVLSSYRGEAALLKRAKELNGTVVSKKEATVQRLEQSNLNEDALRVSARARAPPARAPARASR
jgi:hypothetical protein